MALDINELRPAVKAIGLNAISTQEVLELLDRLEAAERNLDCCRSERNEATVELIERMEKMESALEEVLNSGLLSGQYTIHDKMADLVRAALEESK